MAHRTTVRATLCAVFENIATQVLKVSFEIVREHTSHISCSLQDLNKVTSAIIDACFDLLCDVVSSWPRLANKQFEISLLACTQLL